MNTPTPQNPPAVEQLASRLQSDSGDSATVSVLDEGFSHNRQEQKFTVLLMGKQQNLNGLFTAPDVLILGVQARRSGALVKTTISVKVTLKPALAE